MGVDTNGKPKAGGTTPAMNGQPNNAGTSTRRRRRRAAGTTTYAGWLFDKALKIAVWYCIITLAFRCPATRDGLTDESPKICKPSIQAKEFVQPYIRPYYDQYLDPYVQKAQPYVDQVNEKVYKPGYAVYQQYGAPRVAQARKISVEQWEKTVKPQLDVARKQAGAQYDATLAPHVKKVQDTVQPYYDQVRTSANDIWELEIQPVYRNTAPYAQKIYAQGQDFAVNTALPHAQYAGNTAWAFWARQVWPKIRVLYGENVEPQLHRITERLGRYKDGKRLEAEIKSMESEAKASETSSTIESIASSVSSSVRDAASSPSSAATSAEPEPTISPIEQFRSDLKSWESICAKAVNEGAEDLQERIQEIASHHTTSQAEGVGNALVIQLEETTTGALNSVKARIQSVVEAIPDDADESRLEDANEELLLGIRAAGQSIKGRAQAVREWHEGYKSEIDILVSKALQSTLETIDSIRELRLSEIGQRYADKDLPHKEWSKYNELKKATQSWRDDVEKVSQTHTAVTSAKEAGDEVESRGMAVAEEAAKELGRLKDVAKWKVAAGDASDDFETKVVPPVAERARQQVVEKVEDMKEAIMGTEQGTIESMTSAASEKAQSLARSASASAESVQSKVEDAVKPDSEKPVASQAKSSASSAASVASEAVAGGEKASVKSAASEAGKSTSSIASAASSVVVGTEQGSVESIVSVASESASEAVLGSETPLAESLSSSLSSMVEDNAGTKSLGPKAASILSAGKAKKDAAAKSASSVGEEVSSSVSSASSEISSAASTASSKVFAGANAQILVEAREPILDDIVDDSATYSERVQDLLDGVKDQASYLTQVVEQAFKGVTETQGTVESVTSVASEQYESALAAASSVLFGTEQGAVEKGVEGARERYEQAVTA